MRGGRWAALGLTVLMGWVGALSGCAVAPTHPALVGAPLPELVPVRNFVANTASTGGHRVSPDGKRMAWFGTDGIVPAIWVKSIDGDDAKALRIRARYFRFSGDSRWLGVVADLTGDEDTRVYAVPVDGPDTTLRELMPAPRTASHIADAVDGSADFMVTSNLRDKKVFDLYRVNPRSGERTLVGTNPGNVSWWGVDNQGRLQARAVVQGEHTTLQRSGPDAGRWADVAQWSRWDSVRLFGLNDDGRQAWALSNRGRDKLALVRLDMATGAETPVFESAEVDLDSVTLSRTTRAPLLASYMPGYPARKVFDAALAARLDALAGSEPADVHVMSLDSTDRVLTVSVATDRGTRNFLMRDGREPQFLGESRLSLVAGPHAASRPVRYAARDGLPIHGYLTLPPGAAAGKLPMVLLVHGGPWARDRWGGGGLRQFLANRGYAVLQVNYRGSSGYGRNHMDKAIGEFAGRMHDDLIDGVRWAVDSGVADPARVAIYGASYGGYSALVGATFTPEVFACAVDLVGVADIASLLESAPPYWELGMPWWRRFVGDPARPEDRARMDAKSPVYRAAHAQKPILIMHGVNDPRVKIDQSERMVAALRSAGKEVDYVTFTGDGHGNQKWNNNLTLYRRSEDFLARCLGGRSSGFDYYQLGAWLF